MPSTLLLVLTALAPLGCDERRTAESAQSEAGPVEAPTQGAVARDGAASFVNGGGVLEAGVETMPRIGALFMEAPIFSDMEFPERESVRAARGRVARVDARDRVIRLGYLRHGSTAPVFPQAHARPNCAEGWYELVAGGFVCGKYATLDLNHPKVRLAPHPPTVDGALPYVYGYNLTHGTPLYRTVPSKKDRLRFEPWLAPKPKVKPPPVPESDNPYGESDADAGAASLLTGLAAASTRDPLGLGIDEGSGTPWYLRDHDGGKPSITLDELQGEAHTPILRRMVRGFFVALDRDMKANDARWWRTTAGHVAPYERIYVHKPPTDFHGAWLKDDPPPWPAPLSASGLAALADAGAPPDSPATGASPGAMPLDAGDGADAGPSDAGSRRSNRVVAFMWNGRGKKYQLVSRGKKGKAVVERLDEIVQFRTAVRLSGESVRSGDVVYEESEDGFWVRGSDLLHVHPGPPPAGLQPGEKWVDVNLKSQTLVAFEGTTPVFATLVSSGKEDKEDPEKDHKTPTGEWRIWAKHIAATMDGDVASDGPYSIEDVPWIMYFHGSYALHGAFWHASFGRTRSHGCVNLAPADARALFYWTEPQLPDGWHGIRSTDGRQGTRVVVHE